MMQGAAETFLAHAQRETEAMEAQKAEIQRERKELEEEKAKMSVLQKDASDSIEINVGGKVMETKHSTLMLAKDTFLEAMFSGRWDGSLDRDASEA